ncbi:hypothetical protein AMR76_06570 [Vibrio furnissii]|uniref:Uncharacterized protein n=1 Tax=Vibrio furnissii TaxID=29494 RepID=A0A0Q2R3J3_VIBFU|nr:WYL domain-containing protein [Vibrio furnissii]KQH86749.1 hypothetical protein AMR76_06570 [Vibrio furnissii]
MPESSMKSSSIVRLFELYRKIPSYRGNGVTTKALHQYLLDEGFEVTKRTVERDLLKLSDVAGIYAEREAEGNVWKNSASNLDLLPTMQPSEALLFVTAERYLRRALPPSSEPMLNERISKAEKTLSKFNRLGSWDKKLHIVDGQTPYTNRSHSFGISTAIYEAVLLENQIALSYVKLDTQAAQQYYLNPLAIIVREHDHYLVASKVEQRNVPQLFNFSRMKGVELIGSEIEKPVTFNLEEYIASNPTGWLISNKKERIELKVRGFAYHWLMHNKLEQTQQFGVIDNDWATVTLESHITYDLIGWILRFSTDVIAVKPQALVDEVLDRLTCLNALYGQEDK